MKYIVIIFIVSISSLSFAQNEPVFLRYSTDEKTVEIKWISKSLINSEGANVYRSINNGVWTKMNTEPIKKGDFQIPETMLSQDADLRGLKSVFDQPDFDFSSDPFLSVILLQKVIPSKPLSKYLGIQFSDREVPNSGNVKYKVTLIRSGTEVEFGQSIEIDLREDYLEEGPTEIVSKEKKKSVSIGWKAESERYYGVNIYRATKGTEQWMKINTQPILYTKAPTKGKKSGKPNYLYVDEKVETDVQYDYKLISVDYFGLEAGAASPLTLGAKDDIPPPKPTDLSHEVDHRGMSVLITWKSVLDPDQTGFNVLVSEANDTNLNVVLENISIDTLSAFVQVTAVGRYHFAVEAVDETGNKNLSEIQTFDIEDKIPPLAPTEVSVSIDSGIVSLIWSPNKEDDLAGYYVFRRKSADATFQRMTTYPLDTTKFTEQFNPGIVANFQYMVAAKDTAGNQSYGSKIVGLSVKDKNPPPVPIIYEVLNDSGVVSVNWIASDCHDLAGYNLYRIDSEDSVWAKTNISKIPAFSTRFLDRNISEGIHYSYRMNAYDTASNVSDFSEEQGILIKEKKEHIKIESFSTEVKKNTNNVIMNWKVSDPENVLAFVIFKSEDGGASWLPLTGNLTESSYAYKANPGTFQYRLKVIDRNGKKLNSKSTTVTIIPKK